MSEHITSQELQVTVDFVGDMGAYELITLILLYLFFVLTFTL